MLYGITKMVCEYEGKLWQIIGYKMDSRFISIKTLDGKTDTVVMEKLVNKVCLIDDIRDCYTYEDLKEKYPEYAI